MVMIVVGLLKIIVVLVYMHASQPTFRCRHLPWHYLSMNCRQLQMNFRNFDATGHCLLYIYKMCVYSMQCLPSISIKSQFNRKLILYLMYTIFLYISMHVSCNKYPAYYLSLSLCRISTPDSIGVEIEKKCQSIFPLQNVFVRKVKVLKKPKFDLTKLMEVHAEVTEDTGAAMDKIAAANTVKSLKGSGGRL